MSAHGLARSERGRRRFRVPIAREGYPFILPAAGLALLLWIVRLALGGTTAGAAAAAATLLAFALIFFFRDPERDGPRGADLVIAPADGRVIEVGPAEDPSYPDGRALRISIFLSLFDVHVNRYPVSGVVEGRELREGRFEPAWRRTASETNARAMVGIRAGRGPVLVRQVAGLVARRIVTYAAPGDAVVQGERMGIIRFGSRVDVCLPIDTRPDVRVGDRAVGGITPIARMTGGTEPA